MYVPISQSDTIVNVRTVMVKLGDATIANAAVLCSQRPYDSASMTQPQNVRAPI